LWSLPTAQRAIVVAGCLGMAYTQLTMSPATIELARQLGGNGWHMGLLGALPFIMLVFQFAAAVAANHLRHRRWLWFWLSIAQRLVLVPAGLGPWLWPGVADTAWLWALILSTAANQALLHFSAPLWMSWMGDYLPSHGLNRYFGIRHLWTQWSAALALLLCALLLCQTGWGIRPAFAVIAAVSAVLGVADILLFLWVPEPPVSPAAQPSLRSVFAAPFQHGGFRSFIGYSCFWNFAAMIGAPFISMYLLEAVHMDLYHVLLLWTFSWIGGAVISGRFGTWAEEYGNRPVLVLCTALKGTLMLALLVTPQWPTLVFCVMVPVLMLDAALNAGIAIATNGFLLKHSPAENRTMYIAAGTALAGMVGGVTSIAAGGLLELIGSWRLDASPWHFDGFHIVFLLSLLFRLVTISHARRIHEPQSQSAKHMAGQLIGATPLRIIRLPLGPSAGPAAEAGDERAAA
jgi:MFS family permease